MKHLIPIIAVLTFAGLALTVHNVATAYADRVQSQAGKPGKPDATVIAWLPAVARRERIYPHASITNSHDIWAFGDTNYMRLPK